MSFVEPTIGYHLKPVLAEPELAAQKGVKAGTIVHILRLALPVISRMMLAMAFPKARRQRGMKIADRSLAELRHRQMLKKGILSTAWASG